MAGDGEGELHRQLGLGDSGRTSEDELTLQRVERGIGEAGQDLAANEGINDAGLSDVGAGVHILAKGKGPGGLLPAPTKERIENLFWDAR